MIAAATSLAAVMGSLAASTTVPSRRPSITFILGVDSDPSLPMYALAAAHFRKDPAERTDEVVTGIRSLAEARQLLATAHRAGDQPWGVVNLVVHGNAQGYLELDLHPGGPRADAGSLAKDRSSPLPPGVLDGATEIRLHGCALGRDRRVLASLARWFGGGVDAPPLVRASLWYTAFQAGAPSRSLCAWSDIYYREGERPGPETLASSVPRPVPSQAGEGSGALGNRTINRPGGCFSYEAPVKFTWVVVFPGAAQPPSLPTGHRQLEWLQGQERLRQHLRAAGIAFHRLRWRIETGTRTVDGRSLPALTATGHGRVVHLLRQLTRPKGESGPDPQAAWEDPRYYASSR
jgi:hypothetical protein